MANVCAHCGKVIRKGVSHIVFDGTDCFCDENCAAAFFDNDPGCVEIMLDEGDRLVWEN
jgi:hypothetical protein